jgi:hypothetical protein
MKKGKYNLGVILLGAAVIFFFSISLNQSAVQAGGEIFGQETTLTLNQMSHFLKNKGQFSFNSETQSELLDDKGEKITVKKDITVFLKRPNKLKVTVKEDKPAKEFWYDGSTLILVDLKENLYAAQDAPATIDETLDFAMEKLGMTAPLTDFLFNDLDHLAKNVTSSVYVGITTVGDYRCHHLKFSQENINWAIWIEEGNNPVPRKISIEYKEIPQRPTYSAIFTKWDFDIDLTDEEFVFIPPDGSEKIEFLLVGK